MDDTAKLKALLEAVTGLLRAHEGTLAYEGPSMVKVRELVQEFSE